MSTIDHVTRVLTAGGYSISGEDHSGERVVFEDSTLFGFVQVFESVTTLLDSWEQVQDGFIRSYSVLLSQVASKALNIYCVFLTAEEGQLAQQQALYEVEEDFRSSRKIARAGVSTRDDVEMALAPILPLRQVGSLLEINTRRRLREDPNVQEWLEELLAGDSEPGDIAKELLRRHEDS